MVLDYHLCRWGQDSLESQACCTIEIGLGWVECYSKLRFNCWLLIIDKCVSYLAKLCEICFKESMPNKKANRDIFITLIMYVVFSKTETSLAFATLQES